MEMKRRLTIQRSTLFPKYREAYAGPPKICRAALEIEFSGCGTTYNRKVNEVLIPIMLQVSVEK